MAHKSRPAILQSNDPFPIEVIRVNEKAKTQLIALKRNTGIDSWNVLCRWALCVSLAEPTRPTVQGAEVASSVEMSWRTFAGPEEEAYRALLAARMARDFGSYTAAQLNAQFKLHLHRGISYLAARKVRSVVDLVRLVAPLKTSTEG